MTTESSKEQCAQPYSSCAESDPPRNDDADRDRAEWAQWRLGSGRGEMTEAERKYYGRRTTSA